jgi:RNA polymerase sigma-70 factor (ECF subfamily)
MHDCADGDRADVDRVLAGDASAFEGIVRRWQGPLVNLAYRFCGDRGRAEDMAQEAFLRAFRGLAGWRREALFQRGCLRWRRTSTARNPRVSQRGPSVSMT